MNYYLLILITLVSFVPVYAVQNTVSDTNVELTLNYPDVVTQEKEFVLTTIVKAKSDQMSNFTITISSPEIDTLQNQFHIDNLSRDSTLGNNFNLKIKSSSQDGIVITNISVEYFIKGFFDEKPMRNILTKAFELNTHSKPILSFDFEAPDSIFTGEPFSIKGTVKNQGYDAQNIQITADSKQVNLEGKKIYSISNLDAGKTADFELVLQTPKELVIPTDITVNVATSYQDKSGKEYNLDDSLEIFATQRGILEIGSAQGIWVGNFFIAPVVGVGTIVGSVIGFFIFMWQFKNKKKQKKNKK